MRRPARSLPLHIHGLWAICGASLLLAAASVIQSWRRPVSALSGIAPYSNILDIATGTVLRAPQGKYATVALQRGDQLFQFNGLDWEHAQRLNLHELPDLPIGAVIDLVVQRGAAYLAIALPLTAPDAWEQLALARFGIAALVLWVTPTALLITLTRALRRRGELIGADALVVDASGVTLWFLIWQAGAEYGRPEISSRRTVGGRAVTVPCARGGGDLSALSPGTAGAPASLAQLACGAACRSFRRSDHPTWAAIAVSDR